MAKTRIRTRSGLPLNTLGTRALDEYKRRAQAAGDEAMTELQAAAIETLSQPGHGRTYKRAEIVHRASAPGEPPATDTGTSRRTVGWVTDGLFRWRFGAGSIVLLWLERGTRFILARPWMWQSIRRALPKMRAVLRRRLGNG